MHNGVTFGNKTSPSNWEPFARVCQQLAQKLWYDKEDIIQRAEPYLPNSTFELPATPEERKQFAIDVPDSKNKRVFNKNGDQIS
jgi:hypothetical protein